MLAIHPDCEQFSRAQGTTPNMLKAAQRLFDLVGHDQHITVKRIRCTEGNWVRVSHPGFSCRAIVEINGEEAVLRAVLPRNDETYDTVASLWNKSRRARA